MNNIFISEQDMILSILDEQTIVRIYINYLYNKGYKETDIDPAYEENIQIISIKDISKSEILSDLPEYIIQNLEEVILKEHTDP